MAETKVLKAKCKKTGRYYAMELKSIGGVWKIVNMDYLPPEMAQIVMSEVRQPVFETDTCLLACRTCGGRKLGGCSCARGHHSCSPTMGYQFDCTYCDQLEIDYKRTAGKGPYTQWAGKSNIPGAIKDSYGNPMGSEYDLAADGTFAGYRIVVLNLCNECNIVQPTAALQKKGFEVIEYRTLPPLQTLRGVLAGDKTQLWVVSHRVGYMDPAYVRFIAQYAAEGHGLYIFGDNDPYYVDANSLLSEMFGTVMRGDSRGDNVLGIQREAGGSGIIPNHLITTGLVSFYEGITIAEVVLCPELSPLMFGSDGKVVAAYCDTRERRILVDGGFTRLWFKWDSAGTDRYVTNAAVWLANIEKFGYEEG